MEAFYPSIKRGLVEKAISWAGEHIAIPRRDRDIIVAACNNLLFTREGAWVKSDTGTHDITMGSYPGAEVCELVGLFMLDKLRKNKLEAIIYRDDGAMFTGKNKRVNQLDTNRIQRIFREEGLKLEIKANIQVLDFLDVTLDLVNSEHRPFHKPNNTPLYMHVESNHPPSVIRQIPLTVQRRISDLSSSEAIFNREKPFFENALKTSGYDVTLEYMPPKGPKNSQRKRRITWYNPPFCKSVKTKIGREFLNLVESCFPKTHPLSKIINKNTVKVSPSCMPNMGAKIASLNKHRARWKVSHCIKK